MIRALPKLLAVLIFLATIFTILVYLWGSSESVTFRKAPSAESAL